MARVASVVTSVVASVVTGGLKNKICAVSG